MGCNVSKLDRVAAVGMCRERCNFLDEALRQSYAVADAHVAHMESLTTLAPALHTFFHHLELSNSPLHSPDTDTESDYSPPPAPSSPWDFMNLLSINTNFPTLPPSLSMLIPSLCLRHSTRFRFCLRAHPILEMLDVGKLRYHRHLALNPVPCKLMHVFNHSTPLTHKCMESSLVGRRMGSAAAGNRQGIIDNIKGGGLSSYGNNLCSTLNKLCMWEKKLYDEVKAEEKLRMLHEDKCRQLRRMNKKGVAAADAHKVDSVETTIGVLVTKMKISFQVVDKISSTICDLREDELWPLINTFIFRFHRMWKDMLECYRCQHKEIAEASKTLDASSFNRKLSNSHLDAAIKLKSEIQNWNLSFSDWIHAQRSHVKALNGWLVRCLMHEPEETDDDGSAAEPFSPGRIGAPPVFVICAKWSRAMDNLSEKYVTEAVNRFILGVNELLEKHISELQEKLTLDKELERQMKVLEREEQKMHKVVQARERKTREDTDASVHQCELVGTVGLLSGLQHIFAAMERFTASIAHAFEELCQQIEQDNHVSGESNNIH